MFTYDGTDFWRKLTICSFRAKVTLITSLFEYTSVKPKAQVQKKDAVTLPAKTTRRKDKSQKVTFVSDDVRPSITASTLPYLHARPIVSTCIMTNIPPLPPKTDKLGLTDSQTQLVAFYHFSRSTASVVEIASLIGAFVRSILELYPTCGFILWQHKNFNLEMRTS